MSSFYLSISGDLYWLTWTLETHSISVHHRLPLLPLIDAEKLGSLHQLGQHGLHPAALRVVPEVVREVGEAGLQEHHHRHPHVVRLVAIDETVTEMYLDECWTDKLFITCQGNWCLIHPYWISSRLDHQHRWRWSPPGCTPQISRHWKQFARFSSSSQIATFFIAKGNYSNSSFDFIPNGGYYQKWRIIFPIIFISAEMLRILAIRGEHFYSQPEDLQPCYLTWPRSATWRSGYRWWPRWGEGRLSPPGSVIWSGHTLLLSSLKQIQSF